MAKANKANAIYEKTLETPDMHPDDQKNYRDGVEKGKRYAAEFVASHMEEMTRLISTYPDRAARDQLDELRDEFWSALFSKENP